MLGSMATERIRIIIDTDAVTREVVKRYALNEGARRHREVTKSEVITEIIRHALPDLVEEVMAELGEQANERPPAKKPGRKPKKKVSDDE